jgi:hypothetical protein
MDQANGQGHINKTPEAGKFYPTFGANKNIEIQKLLLS